MELTGTFEISGIPEIYNTLLKFCLYRKFHFSLPEISFNLQSGVILAFWKYGGVRYNWGVGKLKISCYSTIVRVGK